MTSRTRSCCADTASFWLTDACAVALKLRPGAARAPASGAGHGTHGEVVQGHAGGQMLLAWCCGTTCDRVSYAGAATALRCLC
jgi:hypothetical protein